MRSQDDADKKTPATSHRTGTKRPHEFSSFPPPAKRERPSTNEQLVTVRTAGNGDCAFHAAFGTWNGNQFFNANVENLRKIVAGKIQAKKAALNQRYDSANLFHAAVLTAIQQLIAHDDGNRVATFKCMNDLRRAYQQRQAELDEEKQSARDHFYRSFKRNSTLMTRFNELYAALHSGGDEKLSQQETIEQFNQRFQRVRNSEQGAELQEAMQQHDGVLEAYENWSTTTQKLAVEDNQYLSLGVINNYAQYVQRCGVYLLPSELQLLASAHGVSIEYYLKSTGELVHQATYLGGPQAHNTVRIAFNGTNHYEHVLARAEAIANRMTITLCSTNESEPSAAATSGKDRSQSAGSNSSQAQVGDGAQVSTDAPDEKPSSSTSSSKKYSRSEGFSNTYRGDEYQTAVGMHYASKEYFAKWAQVYYGLGLCTVAEGHGQIEFRLETERAKGDNGIDHGKFDDIALETPAGVRRVQVKHAGSTDPDKRQYTVAMLCGTHQYPESAQKKKAALHLYYDSWRRSMNAAREPSQSKTTRYEFFTNHTIAKELEPFYDRKTQRWTRLLELHPDNNVEATRHEIIRSFYQGSQYIKEDVLRECKITVCCASELVAFGQQDQKSSKSSRVKVNKKADEKIHQIKNNKSSVASSSGTATAISFDELMRSCIDRHCRKIAEQLLTKNKKKFGQKEWDLATYRKLYYLLLGCFGRRHEGGKLRLHIPETFVRATQGNQAASGLPIHKYFRKKLRKELSTLLSNRRKHKTFAGVNWTVTDKHFKELFDLQLAAVAQPTAGATRKRKASASQSKKTRSTPNSTFLKISTLKIDLDHHRVKVELAAGLPSQYWAMLSGQVTPVHCDKNNIVYDNLLSLLCQQPLPNSKELDVTPSIRAFLKNFYFLIDRPGLDTLEKQIEKRIQSVFRLEDRTLYLHYRETFVAEFRAPQGESIDQTRIKKIFDAALACVRRQRLVGHMERYLKKIESTGQQDVVARTTLDNLDRRYKQQDYPVILITGERHVGKSFTVAVWLKQRFMQHHGQCKDSCAMLSGEDVWEVDIGTFRDKLSLLVIDNAGRLTHKSERRELLSELAVVANNNSKKKLILLVNQSQLGPVRQLIEPISSRQSKAEEKHQQNDTLNTPQHSSRPNDKGELSSSSSAGRDQSLKYDVITLTPLDEKQVMALVSMRAEDDFFYNPRCYASLQSLFAVQPPCGLAQVLRNPGHLLTLKKAGYLQKKSQRDRRLSESQPKGKAPRGGDKIIQIPPIINLQSGQVNFRNYLQSANHGPVLVYVNSTPWDSGPYFDRAYRLTAFIAEHKNAAGYSTASKIAVDCRGVELQDPNINALEKRLADNKKTRGVIPLLIDSLAIYYAVSPWIKKQCYAPDNQGISRLISGAPPNEIIWPESKPLSPDETYLASILSREPSKRIFVSEEAGMGKTTLARRLHAQPAGEL